MKENESFIVWLQQNRITYIERYKESDLYNRFLKWHSDLEYPLSEKYKKQKYSYHQFTFYLKEYLKILANKKAREKFDIPKSSQNNTELDSDIESKNNNQELSFELEEEKVELIQESKIIEEQKEIYNTIFTEKECFEQIIDYTKSICNIKSHDYSLLISGDPGLGKSYEVEKTLEECLGDKKKERLSGDGFDKIPKYLEWIEGPTKIPPKELYCFLYRENGRVILFDDADDFMDNPTSVNIFKKILDSKAVRTIGYGSKPIIIKRIEKDEPDFIIPNSFNFYGRVIVITNRYFSSIDSAIKSRSLVCEIDLSSKECLKRIERLKSDIIKQIPNASERIANEVLEYLKSISHMYDKLDLRTFKQSIQERIRNPYKWERLIERSIFLKNK